MSNLFKQPRSWADRILDEVRLSPDTSGKPYTFLTSCVACEGRDINEMRDECRKVEVNYSEMAEVCDLSDFERVLGYGPDTIELEKDWHVGYYKSWFRSTPCYFLDHSGIEYIWVLKR